MLVVERALALFLAGLIVLLVLARAWQGDLPSEISGRGVTYADAAATEVAISETATALEGLRSQTEGLWRAVNELQDHVFDDDDRGTIPP